MAETEIGVVAHYFDHLNVAAVTITQGKLKVGDKVHFKGHTTDFEEQIKSMQLEHKSVQEVKKGDDVGIHVEQRVREHDKLLLVTSD